MSVSRLTRILSVRLLLLLTVTTACDDPVGPPDGQNPNPDGTPTGTVSVLLTDAPSDMLDSALVYVSQVYLKADSGRVVISETPAVFELLSLQNGATAQVGAADLPTGAYSELRLVVDSARAVLRPGKTFQDGSSSATMKVPGGQTSGIKVKYDGTITVGEEAMTLVVDFDVSRSFVFQGPPGSPKSVSLKPVLRATRGDQAGSISGSVTPADARATVYALGPGSDTVATALADSVSGNYSLTFLPPGTYAVFAAAEGYVTSSSQDVAVAKGQSVTGVDFQLEADATLGSISGSVQPLDIGATVFLTAAGGDTLATAEPDAATGAYSFDGLEAGTYAVMVSAEGYEPAAEDGIALSAGEAVTGIDFELEAVVALGSISGSVLPVGIGAKVFLTAAGGDTLQTAEPNAATGAWTFDGVEAGLYAVMISAEGYNPAVVNDIDVSAGEAVTGIDVTLTVISAANVTQVQVLLTDAPADMLDSAVVFISQVYLQGGEGGRTVISDEPASFELLSLQGGLTATIGEADLPSGVYSQLRLVVDSARAVLKPGYSFSDGSTSASMKVPSGNSSGFKVMFDGQFEITGETVVIVIDFDVSRSFVFQGPKNAPKSVSLKPTLRATYRDVAASISGMVEPVGIGAHVVALNMNGDTISTAAADDVTGAYTLSFLPPGTYSLIAEADGYEAAEMSDVTVGEKEDLTGVDFVLVEQGSISGTISPPESNATVLALMGPDTVAMALADETGAYTLEGLNQGSYTLHVIADGFVPAEMQDVVVGPAEDVVGVDFTLVAFSSIGGTVTPADAGAHLVALSGVDTVAAADADPVSGAYVLEGLVEGVYTVVASADGYHGSQVDNVAVGPAEDVVGVDFTLVAFSSIGGTVTPAEAGAHVVALSGVDTVAVADADPVSGAYVLEGLAEGVYTVVASADGYQTSQVENVAVGPAEDVTGVDFTLEVVVGAGVAAPLDVRALGSEHTLRSLVALRAQAVGVNAAGPGARRAVG